MAQHSTSRSVHPFVHALLCYHTWVLGAFGLAMVWTGLGPGVTAEKIVLRCDRTTTNQCHLSRTNLYGRQRSQSLAIPSLQGAEIQTRTSSSRTSGRRRRTTTTTTYGVLIHTQEGSFFFDEVFSTGMGTRDRRYAQVDQINRFVATPTQTTLRVVEDSRWFGLVFATAFGAVGLGILAIATAYRITYDPVTHQYDLRVHRWGIGRFFTKRHPQP